MKGLQYAKYSGRLTSAGVMFAQELFQRLPTSSHSHHYSTTEDANQT